VTEKWLPRRTPSQLGRGDRRSGGQAVHAFGVSDIDAIPLNIGQVSVDVPGREAAPTTRHGVDVPVEMECLLAPLRVFLKYIVGRGRSEADSPTLFDVDGWDLTRTTAVTEWEQIDLFPQNDNDAFVVLLENKIDTREHGNQLTRYADRVL